MHNEFDKEEKYRLYRTVKEILHPTISKKNISNYRIIVDEDCLPLRVFYPKKISNLDSVVIYIPGDAKITLSTGKYSEISSNLSKCIDKMVITLDYEDFKDTITNLYDKIYQTIAFIYKSLIDLKISKENIILMGDSTGATIALSSIERLNKEKMILGKMILFYPILSGEYFGKTKYKSILENNETNKDFIGKLKRYYSKNLTKEEIRSKKIFPLKNRKKQKFPNTIILIGNIDPLIDETKEYVEKQKIKLSIIDFAHHGFLISKDKEIINEYKTVLTDFLQEED